ncbi:MAG: hypothetical protein ACRC16_24610, partial [Aeromonas salmonicida]
QLSLLNQWRWLESRVGAGRVDAILAPAGEYPVELASQLIQAELGEADLPHRHDRLKLKLALDRVIQQLINQR